jgi:hypothetical protein
VTNGRAGYRSPPHRPDPRTRITPREREVLKAPFPAFGGKSAIASLVWERFGAVSNYVEPFANSAAVALASSYVPAVETWNDLNGFIANFWRAVRDDPDAVAGWADWPINEVDLHARHAWLVQRQDDLVAHLMGDPDYYDARVAGWWLWGICQWIGAGWCSGRGPWMVSDDGRLVNNSPDLGGGRGINRQLPHLGAGQGINRQLPHLGAGQGINRQLPHLGAGQGINRKLPHLGAGRGINRKLPHLGDAGQGIICDTWTAHLRSVMSALADRLRRVRVCCGNWSRICGPLIEHMGMTGVFLDPPYQMDGRDVVYDNHDADPDGDNAEVFYDVVRWAVEHTDNRQLRIAVCGYWEDGLFPESWECVRWKARGGWSNLGRGRGSENRHRETVWFSPSCLRPSADKQLLLFG